MWPLTYEPLPSFNIDCTFLPKKGASKETSSGLYSSTSWIVRSNILFSFNVIFHFF